MSASRFETENADGTNVANAGSETSKLRLPTFIVIVMTGAAIVFTIWWYLVREQEIVTLRVGAGFYGSDSYELMVEVAKVVERQGQGIRLEVVATENSSKNISLLNIGKLDIATIRSDTPVVANVRLITNLFRDYFQLIARPDAGIADIGDLVGKRIAIPPFGTDEFRSFWALADHYDLPIRGMRWKPMGLDRANDKLLSGEVDVLFTVRSLRDRLLLNLFEDAKLKKFRLNFIEIDQADAMALKRPFLGFGLVSKGAFIGTPSTPERDVKTVTANRVLVTRQDVSQPAIAELTRVLFEHRLDLTIRFALASAITQPQNSVGINTPLHAGAEQYFNRDQPSFLQENAEPIALIITIVAMLISSLLALRRRFSNTQKDRMDTYNYMLLDIAQEARQADNIDEIKQLKMKMFKILETVVRALDKDEVNEDGFQSFSLLWHSVRDIVVEQAGEISSDRQLPGNSRKN